MRKVQIFFGLALLTLVCLTPAANAQQFTWADSQAVTNAVVLTYDPANGNLSYDGNGKEVTTFELKSLGGKFLPAGVNDGVVTGPFDVLSADKFFTLTTAPNQVASVDIGAILPAGISKDDLMADFQISGSLYPSGALTSAEGGGPYLYYNAVPEPTSLALVFCGLLGLVGLRRNRR